MHPCDCRRISFRKAVFPGQLGAFCLFFLGVAQVFFRHAQLLDSRDILREVDQAQFFNAGWTEGQGMALIAAVP